MPNLPALYQWLRKEDGPKMIKEALTFYGTKVPPSVPDNPIIVSWKQEVGEAVSDICSTDSIPWCGLFMAVVAKRAGKQLPQGSLCALDWSHFGLSSPHPMLGDVLTFIQMSGNTEVPSHVALYVGEDDYAYHTLGGNQSDSVCITRIAKKRLYAARRPLYFNQPANVRRIILRPDGVISTNEA